jgi:L-threonylcarbamoyladenylate synthase
VPSHPVARALLDAFPARAEGHRRAVGQSLRPHLSDDRATRRDDLGDSVALILDGGACDVGIESTIVAFGDGEPMLLRPGGVPAAEIARVLGRPPRAPDADAPRASGTLAAHYAPRTPARILSASALASASWRAPDRRRARANVHAARAIRRTLDRCAARRQAYAHDLYANLRALDATDAVAILIEAVPDDTMAAVRDGSARQSVSTTTD